MVEGAYRLDAPLAQACHEATVEIEARLVGGAFPVWLDPRPCDGEPVSTQPELLDQVEILRKALVVLAGDIPVVPVERPPRGVRERVPDRWPTTIRCYRSFDLVSGGCRSPEKTRGKPTVIGHLRLLLSSHRLTPVVAASPAFPQIVCPPLASRGLCRSGSRYGYQSRTLH